LSEGELKSQLEAFRRDPNISGEFFVLSYFVDYLLHLVSSMVKAHLLPSTFGCSSNSNSCEYKDMGSELIFLSHVISSL
jgi:hypothetical protein